MAVVRGLPMSQQNGLFLVPEAAFMALNKDGLTYPRSDVGDDGNGYSVPQDWLTYNMDGRLIEEAASLTGQHSEVNRNWHPRYRLLEQHFRGVMGLPTSDVMIDGGTRRKLTWNDPEDEPPAIETVTGYYGKVSEAYRGRGGKVMSYNIGSSRAENGGTMSCNLGYHFQTTESGIWVPGASLHSSRVRIGKYGATVNGQFRAFVKDSSAAVGETATVTYSNALAGSFILYDDVAWNVTDSQSTKQTSLRAKGGQFANATVTDSIASNGGGLPVFDANATANSSPGSAPSVAITVGSGTLRYLVVAIVYASTTITSTAVSAGVSPMTLLKRQVGGAGYTVELWGLAAPASGSTTITVTNTSTSSYATIAALSFTGVTQTSSVDATGGASATSGSASVPITTLQANDMIVDVIGSAASLTVGAGQTSRNNGFMGSSGDYVATSTKPAAAAGATTTAWTLAGSAAWASASVALKGTGGTTYSGTSTIAFPTGAGDPPDIAASLGTGIVGIVTTPYSAGGFTSSLFTLQPGYTASQIATAFQTATGITSVSVTKLNGLTYDPATDEEFLVTIVSPVNTMVQIQRVTGPRWVVRQVAFGGTENLQWIEGPMLAPDHWAVFYANDEADLATIDVSDMPDETGAGGDTHLLNRCTGCDIGMADLVKGHFTGNRHRHAADFVSGARTFNMNLTIPKDLQAGSDCDILQRTEEKCLATGFWIKRAWYCRGFELIEDCFVGRREAVGFETTNSVDTRTFPLGRRRNPEKTGSYRITLILPVVN